ncbi:protein SMG9-like [Pollicipes pollicipes]|uniref:protein SMG9-like n=1 Tax=Pollicipes pollicipes TaxID=41117 RepID=UPI001884D99D|nr:protein SMG9-like [Pollicipes pollicipes]
MDCPQPVLLTKESGNEARPASVERPITVMRKDETVVLPSIEPAAEPRPASRKQLKEHGLLPQTMSRPCPLLNENLQMVDTAISWLGEGTEYLVVGVVGRQGVGKSTVMSMLGGEAPFCPLKKYLFPPETVQQVLNSEHRTNGVEMLVTPQRVVLLDTQPILSPSIVDLLAQGDRKLPGDSGSLETQMELLALQQLAFLYTVCHVVLVVQDWWVDGDLVRLLQTAEMLKPASSTALSDATPTEHYPQLVFVHNRCTLAHFQPDSISQMQEFYRSAFGSCGLSVSGGVGVGTGHVVSQAQPEVTGKPANLLLLPQFLPAEDGVTEACKRVGA